MNDNEKNDLISVILPVYNVESCLERGIESVVSQTYDNLEIILIDDGSTDSSGVICDFYERRDSRIKVFHTINKGLSEARNYGFEVSQGEYILYIDPDDWINKSYVEEMYKSLKCTDADFVQSNMEYVTSSIINNKNNRFDTCLLTNEEYMKKVLAGEANVSVVGKLFKRYIIDSVKNPVGRLFEDSAIICSYVHLCSRICIENKAIYYYFSTRSGSITASFTRKGLMDYIWSYKRLVKDCVTYFPLLRDEAIVKYRMSIFYLWSMPVRKTPLVYLVFPCIHRKKDYSLVYMRVSKKYILRHYKDYMRMPIKRRLQVLFICYFPWPYVFYLKQRELYIWLFRLKRIQKEMLQ